MASEEMRYLMENKEDLEREHSGRYVAIRREQIVAIGRTIHEVYAILKELHIKNPIGLPTFQRRGGGTPDMRRFPYMIDTGINCDFRSLRLRVFASLRFPSYNAKAQRRKDAKDVATPNSRLSSHFSHPTDHCITDTRQAKKTRVCGGAKYRLGKSGDILF